MQNIVVVVDKTCEIGGDGVVPHPAIGNARWLPVESFKKEGQVLHNARTPWRESRRLRGGGMVQRIAVADVGSSAAWCRGRRNGCVLGGWQGLACWHAPRRVAVAWHVPVGLIRQQAMRAARCGIARYSWHCKGKRDV
jgi:hypothetical protein